MAPFTERDVISVYLASIRSKNRRNWQRSSQKNCSGVTYSDPSCRLFMQNVIILVNGLLLTQTKRSVAVIIRKRAGQF